MVCVCMSTKKLELKTPSKKREDFPVVGAYRLFKKRDAPASEAKGMILRPLTPEGKEDFSADGYVVWFSAIEALKTGGVTSISSFLVKHQEKAE